MRRKLGQEVGSAPELAPHGQVQGGGDLNRFAIGPAVDAVGPNELSRPIEVAETVAGRHIVPMYVRTDQANRQIPGIALLIGL